MFRRHERTKLDLYVNKIVGDEPFLSRLRDISAGGVYLYKLLEPNHGLNEIGLEIQLPDSSEVIWAVGEIVRSDDARESEEGTAIRFKRIAETDRDTIRRYVERQRQRHAA